MDEIGRWLLAMIFVSTSQAPTLHQTCVISKNSCKQEELSWARKAKFNELTVYLMHEEIAKENGIMDEIYWNNEDRRDGNELLLCKIDQMLV